MINRYRERIREFKNCPNVRAILSDWMILLVRGILIGHVYLSN